MNILPILLLRNVYSTYYDLSSYMPYVMFCWAKQFCCKVNIQVSLKWCEKSVDGPLRVRNGRLWCVAFVFSHNRSLSWKSNWVPLLKEVAVADLSFLYFTTDRQRILTHFIAYLYIHCGIMKLSLPRVIEFVLHRGLLLKMFTLILQSYGIFQLVSYQTSLMKGTYHPT